MPAKWLDFKALRERVRMSEVLASYNVSVKVKGDQAQGFCPLPTHERHEGKRRSPSFSVNLRRGIWRCFSCNAGGNVLDLVCRLEHMNPEDAANVRKAAVLLDERFPTALPCEPRRSLPAKLESSGVGAPAGVSVVVNAPLEFELKHLDAAHPYLAGRGLTPETIAHFGLGYCAKGLMAGRIAIPLHDSAGKLIGYAGRLVDDAAVNEEHPKYLFPGARERAGFRHEFHKGAFLYNGHLIGGAVRDLVVVEGFASVWWLWQHGYHRSVALMGSTCSKDQVELIVQKVSPGGQILVFTDLDDAGRRGAGASFVDLGSHRAMRYVRPHLAVQPTDCTSEELAVLLQEEAGYETPVNK